MTVFVDTSGLYSLLDADEKNHVAAGNTWVALLESGQRLFTTNYIVVETCSILHRRLGIPAVRRFLEDILPAILVDWVDITIHTAGVNSVLVSSRRGPSLVDCISFIAMRRFGITTAFTFDDHFRRQGFDCRPAID